MFKDLIEIAKRIILIARDREKDKSYNDSDPLGKDPYDQRFFDELKDLDIDHILALQAIVYLGRDKDYDSSKSPNEIFASAFDNLKESQICERDAEIYQLVDSSILFGNYLREGYRILGIDI